MRYEVSDVKYTQLVEGIREYFVNSNHIIWDRRNKLKTISFLDEKMMVKSFKVPHLLNRVAYTFFRE